MMQTETAAVSGNVGTPVSVIKRFGPAWIVSAVACGPATMASVSIAGGLYGYQVLWVVVLSAFFAFIAQYMAAKVGIIGQKGIIALVEETWGKPLAWVLTLDALAATWLAAAVLMKALVGTTVLITGWSTGWWPVIYGLLIFALVGFGGYKALEFICKLLVAGVVVCFVVTVAVVAPDLKGILRGFVPTFPGGAQGGLMMAGIMGGAVHITIIAMHTYNVNARKWRRSDMGLARMDTLLSMFVAFGLYSAAIYLASAAVIHPQGTPIKTAFDLAKTLTPVLGPYAGAVFLAGLYGAVLSTITPTFLAGGYFLADKMGWGSSVADNRFKAVVLLGCLVSMIGPMLKGSFLTLLVVMLALGLCGTPLIILILLLLLNKKDWAKEHKNSLTLNIFGFLTLAITTLLAVRFIVAKLI